MTAAVELIPGEHYLVLVDADEAELPDRVAREELATLAVTRQAKPTLGLDSLLHAQAVLDDLIAALLATTVETRYTAAKRWFERYRDSRAPRTLAESDEEPVVREALESASELASMPSSDSAASLTLRRVAPSQWVVSAQPGSVEVAVRLVPDTGMAEVIFREVVDW